MRQFLAVAVCLAVLGGAIGQVGADDRLDRERQLDQLIQQQAALQKRIGDMENRLQKAEDPALQAKLLQFQQENTDLRNELRQGSGSDLVPGWLTKDLKFAADVRVRYEMDMQDDRTYLGINNAGAIDGLPTRFRTLDEETRQRGRYRLRFGFVKNWGEEWSAGFRLVSTQGDATSSNQTFDNYFQEQPVGIDRAWIMYQPSCIQGLTLAAGKFENPFVSTNMIWDSDVSPEGVYESMRFEDVADGFVPFVTLGQMIAEELAFTDDLTLMAYQAGFEWDVTPEVKWTQAVTYYDWDGFEDATAHGLPGTPAIGNVWPNGARTYNVRGNTVTLRPTTNIFGAQVFESYLDAGDFDIVNFTTFVDFDVTVAEMVIPVQLFGDIAWNAQEAERSYPAQLGAAVPALRPNVVMGNANWGRRDYDDAHSFGVKLGKAKKKGDLEFKYKYARIEANSIVGFFSDSDFGYANQMGHAMKLRYMVHDKVYVAGNFFFTRPIYDPDASENTEPVVQFDVVFKF